MQHRSPAQRQPAAHPRLYREPKFIFIMLCLSLALPILAQVQSLTTSAVTANAAPAGVPQPEAHAQQPASPLIAFERDGNVWRMNSDGTDQKQLTTYTDGIAGYRWSPSGRYLLVQHGVSYYDSSSKQTVTNPPGTSLYDTTTGSISDVISTPHIPSWAEDADELLAVIDQDNHTSTLNKLAFDGTLTPVGSFTDPMPCGGPSGPGFTPPYDLLNAQTGGPFVRQAYDTPIWNSAQNVAYIDLFCGGSVGGTLHIDLTSGTTTQLPFVSRMSGPSGILAKDGALVSPEPFSVYDPATGNTAALANGMLPSWGPGGTVYFTRTITGDRSTFSSPLEDSPIPYTDNTIQLWRTDASGSEPSMVASFPGFGAGIPQVSPDGSTIIIGIVDNPSDLMDVDPATASAGDLSGYAKHQKTLTINVKGGTVTTLSTDAVRPKLQPKSQSASIPVPATTSAPMTVPAATIPNPPVTGSGANVVQTPVYNSGIPILAITCQTDPGDSWISPSNGTYQLPAGCSLVGGVGFTASDATGHEFGSCVTDAARGECDTQAPLDADISLRLNEQTIPPGFHLAHPDNAAMSINLGTGGKELLAPFVFLPDNGAGTTPSSEGGSIAPGDNWIAYTGADGNIWLMQPDGSGKRQITTDASETHTYTGVQWSHDGTMLVFSSGRSGGTGDGLWIQRNGTRTLLPNTGECHDASFSADNTRVLYTCNLSQGGYDPAPSDLQTNPVKAFVASSALDGSNQKSVATYALEKGDKPYWTDGKSMVSAYRVDVRASDGAILVVAGGFHKARLYLLDASGEITSSFDMSNSDERMGPFSARFTPDGQHIIASWCVSKCIPQARQRVVGILDLSGNVIVQWTQPVEGLGQQDASSSPDGAEAVFVYQYGSDGASTIAIVDPDGKHTDIALGSIPAWQPGSATSSATPSTNVPAETPDIQAAPIPTAVPATANAPSQPATGSAPASGQLAFGAKDGGHWDIYVHDFSSGQNLQLTNSPGTDEWAPAYSHDGTQLAYLSDVSGSNQVWLMNPDGSNQHQISDWNGDSILYVGWSGDDSVFYVTMQGSSGKYVMQMPVSGGDFTSFLPISASRPVVNSHNGLLVYVIDNESVPQLARGNEGGTAEVSVSGEGDAPSMDPVGSVLVYQTGTPGSRRIGVALLDGEGMVVPPASGFDDSSPVITRDNGFILWVVDDGTTQTIWSATAIDDGSQPETAKIDTGSHEKLWYLSWRPHSERQASLGTTTPTTPNNEGTPVPTGEAPGSTPATASNSTMIEPVAGAAPTSQVRMETTPASAMSAAASTSGRPESTETATSAVSATSTSVTVMTFTCPVAPQLSSPLATATSMLDQLRTCTEVGGVEVTFTYPSGSVYGPITGNFPLEESRLDLPYAKELTITANPATLPGGWIQPPNPLRVTIPEEASDYLTVYIVLLPDPNVSTPVPAAALDTASGPPLVSGT